jgi:hypothetical protein
LDNRLASADNSCRRLESPNASVAFKAGNHRQQQNRQDCRQRPVNETALKPDNRNRSAFHKTPPFSTPDNGSLPPSRLSSRPAPSQLDTEAAVGAVISSTRALLH